MNRANAVRAGLLLLECWDRGRALAGLTAFVKAIVVLVSVASNGGVRFREGIESCGV